ncbi:general secretion pathway protein GspK [Seongchinamella unica]|uniref:General secretion pathway protein GspK n=1 Tax=Seongchinamella unica TaxID=2547392 RepID=A0A4R5LUU1_9GAMM|nr:general secretion pathway protein GspK [Seongchinamella unica]TDG15121.1 general secretion pathway protein GspK [Seongchinamella unica]
MVAQRGVALAIVVWFIAGMSLLVAGIVAHARIDTRTTQIHLARAKAIAAGDGAIYLAMMERDQGFESSGQGPMISDTRHRLGELEVRVQIAPASGFVDLNKASEQVMAALFSFAGGLETGEAKIVADNVVKWRLNQGAQQERRFSRAGSRTFYSLEDVLRVDGVSRALLDGIRDYVAVGSWTSGSMNWSASPGDMMEVLTALNPEQSDSIGRRREAMSQAGGSRVTRRATNTGAFRADAYVEYGGRTWLRRRWLRRESGGDSSLPWRVVRTEAPRVVAT